MKFRPRTFRVAKSKLIRNGPSSIGGYLRPDEVMHLYDGLDSCSGIIMEYGQVKLAYDRVRQGCMRPSWQWFKVIY